MTVERICPVCQGRAWSDFLTTGSGRVLVGGDQRVVPGDIHKLECSICGTISNARIASAEELQNLYTNEYLGQQAGMDHIFFDEGNMKTRGRVIYEWLRPWLPQSPASLIEIGCGEGHVLMHVAKEMPWLKCRGIEGSQRASDIARQAGLEVDNLLISGDYAISEDFDVIICFGVLEHIEEIESFIGILLKIATTGGRYIFGVPLQDFLTHDVFFSEHIWHWTSGQFIRMLSRMGLNAVMVDNNPDYPGFGLFVCHKSDSAGVCPEISDSNARSIRDWWLGTFKSIDNWLAENGDKRIAVFGAGEILCLLMAYTDLGKREIIACLDEDIRKHGLFNGIPVYAPDWLNDNEVDAVILTLNLRYQSLVAKKMEGYGVEVYSWGCNI